MLTRALNSLGLGLDKAIAVVNPAAGLRRAQARMLLDRTGKATGKRFAAANVNRMTGDWNPASSNPNALLAAGGAIIRGRTRQLVRDFPYFSRAVKCMVNYTVGTGTTYQARVKTADGKIDKPTCEKIESAFRAWQEKVDVRGRAHYGDFERLVKRTECECGEYLVAPRVVRDRTAKSGYRFALQAIDPDRLSASSSTVPSGNSIWQGVEYNPTTGQIEAYHISADTSGLLYSPTALNAVRIPAADMLHGFEDLWADQLRGVTPFVSAILVAHDLSDYVDAEIDTAKMMSKYLAIVTTDDAATWQGGRGLTTESDGLRTESLENCIIEYLKPNEKVNFATASRSASNFSAFNKLILRMVSISTDITYELISGDYDQISFSNLRGIRMDLNRNMRPHQARHTRQFNEPVKRRWMDFAVLNGDLDLPGYWKDPRHYWEGEWQPPGMESVDPQKEAAANELEVTSGFRSPQQIISERGGDWESILVQIKQWQDRAKELGIDLGTAKKALAAPVDMNADMAALVDPNEEDPNADPAVIGE